MFNWFKKDSNNIEFNPTQVLGGGNLKYDKKLNAFKISNKNKILFATDIQNVYFQNGIFAISSETLQSMLEGKRLGINKEPIKTPTIMIKTKNNKFFPIILYIGLVNNHSMSINYLEQAYDIIKFVNSVIKEENNG